MNKKPAKIATTRSRKAAARPGPRISERLPNTLVDSANSAVSSRHDGWTPEKIRIFLDTLATCGVVEDAARAAGMSRRSAYNLRNSIKGRHFRLAWQAAQRLARHSLTDELFSRALHGCVEIITRDGEVWGERHRFDNRLTMAVLNSLNNQAVLTDNENAAVQVVADEFEEFVGFVATGNDKAATELVENERRKLQSGHPGVLVQFLQPDGTIVGHDEFVRRAEEERAAEEKEKNEWQL